jgi:hypothetical protein
MESAVWENCGECLSGTGTSAFTTSQFAQLLYAFSSDIAKPLFGSSSTTQRSRAEDMNTALGIETASYTCCKPRSTLRADSGYRPASFASLLRCPLSKVQAKRRGLRWKAFIRDASDDRHPTNLVQCTMQPITSLGPFPGTLCTLG